MKWWELKVTVPSEASEAVSALLQEWEEVQGVSIEGRVDGGPPHPEWGEWFDESLLNTENQVVTVYVPETTPGDGLVDRLHRELDKVEAAGLDLHGAQNTVILGTVDETDWENAWKAHYQPMHIGRRLAIVPTWQADEYDAGDRMVIQLEPGMAFGTGTHPTTQLCMETLESLPLADKFVLDIGCGTGVLAMTAALLGAQRVVGVDIDPVAVASASMNVTLNQLGHIVDVQQGNLLDGWNAGLFDVAVANILRDAVILLTPQAWSHLKPGGLFLSSGYVDTQADRVEDALRANGFVEIRRLMKEDWVVLLAVKPS